MILLNPRHHARPYPDARSREIMEKTIAFFESKGKRKLKDDDCKQVWYADFLDFVRRERIFATLLTPAGYGDADARWDTWRICEFAEILGFYGLAYWYTWQVSVLGLGPIWMSDNEEAKRAAAKALENGGIFAFGLSERAHGADVYSTSVRLKPIDEGRYLANGEKYYIGNANQAAMVSTFGKLGDGNDYVFFVTNPKQEGYECKRNVVNSQSFVAQFALHDVAITEADVLSKGQAAWDAALNTVNIGKYNLGWASIGMCTHALYEAIHHAAHRRLYDMAVTDFPHVKRLFTDAYARLVAMKLVALRAADYFRSATTEDRRYLLYNPVVKMKVTTQGEDVINHLWDVIAAKGFEKDMYFEMAARDIRALPKLEGTVHVNIALIVKFMINFFTNHADLPPVGQRSEPVNDDFLFHQGTTRGLGKIRFHDYEPAFEAFAALANVAIFRDQLNTFKECMMTATPDQTQMRDTDFLLSVGEIFTTIVYAQLILENAKIYAIGSDLVDQIFDVLVRDFSAYAIQLYGRPLTNAAQMEYCMRMVKKPATADSVRDSIWNEVLQLKDTYEMNP